MSCPERLDLQSAEQRYGKHQDGHLPVGPSAGGGGVTKRLAGQVRPRPMAVEAVPGSAARQSVIVTKNLHASLSTLKDTAEQLQRLCVEHVDAGDALAECARQLNRSSLQCIQSALDKVHCELLCDFVRVVTYHSSNRAVQCPIGMNRRRWFKDQSDPFAAQDTANKLRYARGSMLLNDPELEDILDDLQKQGSRRVSMPMAPKSRLRGNSKASQDPIDRWAYRAAVGFQKPERPGPEEREKMYLRTLRPYRPAGSPDITPHASPRIPRPSPRLMEHMRPPVIQEDSAGHRDDSEASFQTDLAQSFSEMSAGQLLGEGRPWTMWSSRLSETSSSEGLSLDDTEAEGDERTLAIPRLALDFIIPHSSGRPSPVAASARSSSPDHFLPGPLSSDSQAAAATSPGVPQHLADGLQSQVSRCPRHLDITIRDAENHHMVDGSLQLQDKAGAASRMLAELKERRLGRGSQSPSPSPSPAAIPSLQVSSEALKTNRELQADAQGQEPILDALMLYIPPSAAHPKLTPGLVSEPSTPAPARWTPTNPSSRAVSRIASPNTPARLTTTPTLSAHGPVTALRRAAASPLAGVGTSGHPLLGTHSSGTPPGTALQLGSGGLSRDLSGLTNPSWGLSALSSPTQPPDGYPFGAQSGVAPTLQLGGLTNVDQPSRLQSASSQPRASSIRFALAPA
ncbi:hypothetical protein WJX74_009226 [Apatococcus lobatus]|uniref:Uncharacterized protein n=1 Tax=Apatococcus lobatus TaxID=904363 RepID=A0AAW1QTF7_9CHLO